MKKHWKTLIFAAAATAVLACGTSAFAVSDVHATIYEDPVFVEGQEVYCWSPSGKETDYLSYNGTTYIPIRTAGEWMGKNVTWDEATKTITLDGTSEKVYHGQSTDRDVDTETQRQLRRDGTTVQLRDDITVVIDQITQNFKNASGQPVYPITYNDMNYLPVRNIGELLNMTVTYQPAIERVQGSAIFMRTAMTDTQIKACEDYINDLKNSYSYTALGQSTTLPQWLKDSWTMSNGEEDDLFHLIRQVRLTNQQFQEVIPLIDSCLDVIRNTPKPDVALFSTYYDNISENLPDAQAVYESVKQSAASSTSSMPPQLLDRLSEAMDSITSNINWMETVLNEKY